MKNNYLDWLKEFTKEEIIEYIKRNYFSFNPIKKSDLLFQRWELKSKEMQEKQKKSMEMLKAVDATGRDKLAEQFNASISYEEKAVILKKMEPYNRRLKSWLDFNKKLDAEEKEIDRIYASIEIERKRENK